MTGRIKKLPDGRYVARWRDGRTQRKRVFRTLKLAEAAIRAANDRNERRRNGLPAEAGSISFRELHDAFLEQYDGRPQSKTTLEYRLRAALGRFADEDVRHIQPMHVAAWYGTLQSYAPSTQRNTLKALRQVFAAAVAWRHIDRNPASDFKPTRRTSSADTNITPFESWAEVEAVAAKAGRYGSLVRFACATGLRPQEWAALEWRDVDLEARTLSVRRTLQAGEVAPGIAKTRSSLRTVLLQHRALEALRELPRPLRTEQPVFTDSKGVRLNPSSFRRNVFEKAVTAAGLEARTPKDMRHTFATLSLAANAQLQDVSRQLGHTDIKTTLDYYVRWLPIMDERLLNTLDAAASVSPVCRDEAQDAAV